jgi:NAD(P)H-hydrate epimerase
VTDKLERRVKELMTLRLPANLAEFVTRRKVSVAVIGPGIKPGKATTELVKGLSSTGIPIIVDGGALQPDTLGTLKESATLTPHVGEFQRLVSEKLPSQRSELKAIAQRFAKQHKVTVVLKGEPTYVVHPDGSLYENTTGNPGLATAGTGDVLSGVIAGMIAQHVTPDTAAEAGVYLHGLAGDIAAKTRTQPGMIAGDVIEAIPAAYAAAASSKA